MIVFLPQLNDLEIWGADVGNAYLEAYTDEKLCIIAGPEFKELQGHLLIMIKALYRTCSGGARWHDRLSDIPQELNDTIPTKNGRELVEKWVVELVTNF